MRSLVLEFEKGMAQFNRGLIEEFSKLLTIYLSALFILSICVESTQNDA